MATVSTVSHTTQPFQSTHQSSQSSQSSNAPTSTSKVDQLRELFVNKVVDQVKSLIDIGLTHVEPTQSHRFLKFSYTDKTSHYQERFLDCQKIIESIDVQTTLADLNEVRLNFIKNDCYNFLFNKAAEKLEHSPIAPIKLIEKIDDVHRSILIMRSVLSIMNNDMARRQDGALFKNRVLWKS